MQRPPQGPSKISVFYPKFSKNHKIGVSLLLVADILQTTVQPSHKPLYLLCSASFCCCLKNNKKRGLNTTGGAGLSATPATRTFKNMRFCLKFIKKDDFFWNFVKSKKIHEVPEIQKSQNLLGPPKFTIFTKIGDLLFWNFREFWSSQLVEIQEYTGFPKFTRLNSDFPRKMSTPIFLFSSKSGPHLFWNSQELGPPQCVKM